MASNASAPVTVFSSRGSTPLTKTHRLDSDGKYHKVGGGSMTNGEYQVVNISRPSDFVELRKKLKSNHGLSYGTPNGKNGRVVRAEDLHKHPDAIARTNECMAFREGGGVMMVDVDPLPGSTPLTLGQARDALFQAAPALCDAPYVWMPSSSSYIRNSTTGEEITGLRGQRFYFFVADARDITRAGRDLCDRLWLHGYGSYVISKSGQLLCKTIIDGAVWRPSGFDFAAPPVCEAPLEQQAPAPVIFNDDAPFIDTSAAIPELTAEEKKALHDLRLAAKTPDVIAQRDKARAEWVGEKIAGMNLPPAEIETNRARLFGTLETGRLYTDFVLKSSDGKLVSVGKVLDNPTQWHNKTFYDPLEWDYGGSDKRIARLNLRSGGRPYIYSFAHGGRRYELMRQTLTIRLETGDMPGVQESILEVLRKEEEVFERASGMAYIHGHTIRIMGPNELINLLERRFRFEAYDGRAKRYVPKDCPYGLVSRLLSNQPRWQLPVINAVTPFPVVRTDGSIIEKPGYDADTGIVYATSTNEIITPRVLSDTGLVAALERIWEPFAMFPFVSDIDRGVFLSALLTTVVRAALPVCVAFLVRAPSPGTGKSRLSECLMIIIGAPEEAMPLVEDRGEVEKRIFANLLTGQSGQIFDNITRDIDDSSVCSYLTTPSPKGRILGRTETVSARNIALWVFNGNNVSAVGDAFRRILPITLDADCESPESRRFPFDPRVLIHDRLDAYRQDLLSVLLTFKKRGRQVATDALGSFELWDDIVRQCVCWLKEENLVPSNMVGGIDDPNKGVAVNKAEDTTRGSVQNLLASWYAFYGCVETHLKDIEALCNQPFAQYSSNGNGGNDDPQHQEKKAALIAAVEAIARGRGKNVEGRWLGKFIKANAGRVVGGYRIDRPVGAAKEPGWVVNCVAWDKPPAG